MSERMHLNDQELEDGLEEIRQSPIDNGTLAMIVRRPAVDQREVLQEGRLSVEDGLEGDCWRNSATPPVAPDTQLTIMNARAIALIAREPNRWRLAGDQLYVDLDLSTENLPTGTRLVLGSAEIEITAVPHNGCRKFRDRFGLNALKFVNSTVGKQLRLRGVYAKVLQPGVVRVEDIVRKR